MEHGAAGNRFLLALSVRALMGLHAAVAIGVVSSRFA